MTLTTPPFFNILSFIHTSPVTALTSPPFFLHLLILFFYDIDFFSIFPCVRHLCRNSTLDNMWQAIPQPRTQSCFDQGSFSRQNKASKCDWDVTSRFHYHVSTREKKILIRRRKNRICRMGKKRENKAFSCGLYNTFFQHSNAWTHVLRISRCINDKFDPNFITIRNALCIGKLKRI